jgi:hypothetical protein
MTKTGKKQIGNPIVVVEYYDIVEDDDCTFPEKLYPVVCKVYGRLATNNDVVRVIVEEDSRESYESQNSVFAIPKGCVISIRKMSIKGD